MKDCENHNTSSLSLVIDAVRKPLRNDASNAAMHDSKTLRLLRSECNAAVNFSDELRPKIGVA